MSIKGKKIFVIGASTALEKVIVSSLLEDGASVVIANNEPVEFSNTISDVFDIFDHTQIEERIGRLIMQYGKFDGFLYCVTHSDFRPLSTVKHDNLVNIMNENFFSFIDALRTLVKKHGLKEGASVVAISSISSIKAMKAKLAFCSAKAALDAAVRCLAVELASKKIRVNSIQKGIVYEDFSKENIQAITEINGGAEIDKLPLGITNGIEIANTIKFLMSDQTKTLTGTSIVIDGGYTV